MKRQKSIFKINSNVVKVFNNNHTANLGITTTALN